MRNKLIYIGILLIVLGVVAAVVAATAEPYIALESEGFGLWEGESLTMLTLGVETSTLGDMLAFDGYVFGVYGIVYDVLIGQIGAGVSVNYGTDDTFIEFGAGMTTDRGFVPYLAFKLTIPVFALWGPSTGGL